MLLFKLSHCGGEFYTGKTGVAMVLVVASRYQKKGIAFPLVQAHSYFTAINLDNFLVSVLTAQCPGMQRRGF
nr:hypothetical protein [Rhodoferax sp.]